MLPLFEASVPSEIEPLVATKVIVPPAVVSESVTWPKLMLPLRAMNCALLAAPVCRAMGEARAASNVIAFCAVMLICTPAPTDCSAPRLRVPATPTLSVALSVPSVALKKVSRVPTPAAPAMMLISVAGTTRSSSCSQWSRRP